MYEEILIVLLFFQSGYLNAITFNNYLNIPSGYMSGIIPRIGFDLYYQNYKLVFFLIVNYVSFQIGCILLSIFYKYSKIYFIFLLLYFLTLIVHILFVFVDNSIYYIWLSSLINGVQNGVSTLYSNGKIRTTHITGLTTDFSLSIIDFIHKDYSRIHLFKHWCTSVLGLLIGSYFGLLNLIYLNHYCIIIPMCIYFLLFVILRYYKI
jgi:uncharacterized membrane protein YoaK (UPF0700 family)